MQPQTAQTAQTAQPDLQALALTKAIRAQESGGNYSASGDVGTSKGAYQFQAPTWKAFSQQILGDPNAPMTPENQNAVAYGMIKTWKDAGMGPAQIAAKWNSGSENGWENKIGTTTINGKQVPYNVPQYVQGVVSQFKNIYPQVQQQFGDQSQGGGMPVANADTTGANPQAASGPSVSGFVGNAFNDAGSVIGSLANAAMHPIDTAKTLLGTVAGGVEKLAGANNEDTQMFDNILHSYAQKYGGNSITDVIKNIGHTLYTQPVSTLLDLSTILDGAGAAVGAVGKVADISKVAELSKAADYISSVNGLIKTGTPEANALLRQEGTITQIGNALTTIGKYTNPLGAVAGLGSKAIGLGGKIGGEALGISTGAGYGAIKGAFNAGTEGGAAADALRAGMRGGDTATEDLLDSANQAIKDLKFQKSSEYQSALNDIKSGAHTLSQESVQPIFDQFDNLLNKYEVRQTKDGLDFSNSRLRNEPATVGDIEDIHREIQKYTSGEKAITPANIDDLKQFIDARYSPGTRGSSFTSQLNDTVRKTLRSNVPGYQEMTKGYEAASHFEKDVRQVLSVGGKANKETIVKKLTSSMRANNDFRRSLLQEFSSRSGSNLLSQAAGVSLQSWIPLGLAKYEASLASIINPHILMALPATSPRLVGEFLLALGKGNAKLEKIAQAFINYKGPLIAKAAVISSRRDNGKSSGGSAQ